MPLTAEQISDLTYTTRTHPNVRGKDWTNLMASLQNYVAMPLIFKNKKMDVQSGTSIDFLVQYQSGVNFEMTGMYDVDSPTNQQTMTKGNVPWRYAKWGWIYDEREEELNGGMERIVKFITTKEAAEMQGAADGLEAQWWGAPSSSSDQYNTFGVQYWVPYVTGTPAFQGGDPSGFTGGAAGLPVATYPAYQNWSGQYTLVTKDDLISKLKDATYKCKFKSPIGGMFPEVKEPAIRRLICTTYSVRKSMESLADAQNENLGLDLDRSNDKVTFQGIQILACDYLEGSSLGNPVYGLDFETLYPVIRKGWWMKKKPPVQDPNSHNVKRNWTDCIFNVCCDDRRRQFVLATT